MKEICEDGIIHHSWTKVAMGGRCDEIWKLQVESDSVFLCALFVNFFFYLTLSILIVRSLSVFFNDIQLWYDNLLEWCS